jgi:hypothetical protein
MRLIAIALRLATDGGSAWPCDGSATATCDPVVLVPKYVGRDPSD